jgi:hypothetical protein
VDAGELACTARFAAGPPGCFAAQTFAARDSVALVPVQSSIDRYFERWSRALAAEPQLKICAPQDYRLEPPSQITLFTTNAAAVAAWSQQVVTTGDLAIDSVLAPLGPIEINSFFQAPSGDADPWVFLLHSMVVRNEEVFASLLAPTLTALPPVYMAPEGDGTWSWQGDTADVHCALGWGDCLSGCEYVHQLEAVIPADGPATVYDLGGDPISLAPTTLPP